MLNQGSDTTPCERVTMNPTAVTRKIEPSSLERTGRKRSLERVFVPALRWLKFSEHRCRCDFWHFLAIFAQNFVISSAELPERSFDIQEVLWKGYQIKYLVC